MKSFFILCLNVLVINAQDFNAFIKAVHMVESSGRTGAIQGDYDAKTKQYKALGPLQVQYGAWLDATRYDRTIGGRYSDCVNLEYSKKIFRAYLKLYANQAYKHKDWRMCARIWNGGPQGHTKIKTNQYWRKVQLVLLQYSK